MKICPRCKTKNLNSFKKCDGCGISLEGVYIRRNGTDHQQREKAAKKYSGIVTGAGGKWYFAGFVIFVAGLFTAFTSYMNWN